MRVTVRHALGTGVVLAGRSGLRRTIGTPHVAVPDMTSASVLPSCTGSVVHLRPSQLRSLSHQEPRERRRLVGLLIRSRPACFLVTGGTVPAELLRAAEKARIAVVKAGSGASLARRLGGYFSAGVGLHGVLVDIFGLGTLLIGESAVGKSEAALDLVLRGHKLVADDVVLLQARGETVIGYPTETGAHLLQIRGLGIVNVRALYGESATVDKSEVGLVVELEEWKRGHQYSMVGMRERRHRLLGVNVPYLKLPVKPGRNMASLIEVAVRNQILKNRGVYTSRELNRTLMQRMRS